MGYLEKNFILHRRGEDKKLLPVDFFMKELNATVSMKPMTRGKFLSFSAKIGAIPANESKLHLWEELIQEHLINPKFTIEEIRSLKMVWVKGNTSMVSTDPIDLFVDVLYKVSGIEFQAEEQLKKK